MKIKFNRSYFTKDAFEKVGLDIDKPMSLPHFVHPLIKLFALDHVSVQFTEMVGLLTGDLRQNRLTEDENTDHYLFLEHDKIDGNAHYTVNKNFNWDWYDKFYEENQSAANDALVTIDDLTTKAHHCKCATCDNEITESRSIRFPICDDCLRDLREIIKERREKG